ncbi:hypothetical protein [Streptomyces sp. NPDC095613]|uniref:hypothetical protein n=1 Tax=Streptomyces sp. NPDC095613 TaxID=3155540 RepID=UPI00331D5720
MRKLVAAVYVQDPSTREELILRPGDSPTPDLAALVINPAAWDASPTAAEPSAADEPASTTRLTPQSEMTETGAKKTPQRRPRSTSSS